jgi:hypothetical protein
MRWLAKGASCITSSTRYNLVLTVGYSAWEASKLTSRNVLSSKKNAKERENKTPVEHHCMMCGRSFVTLWALALWIAVGFPLCFEWCFSYFFHFPYFHFWRSCYFLIAYYLIFLSFFSHFLFSSLLLPTFNVICGGSQTTRTRANFP